MERVGIIVLYPVGENVPADEEREYALMTIRDPDKPHMLPSFRKAIAEMRAGGASLSEVADAYSLGIGEVSEALDAESMAPERPAPRGWTRHSSGSYWCLHCNATGDAPGDQDCSNCGGLGWRGEPGATPERAPEVVDVPQPRVVVKRCDEVEAEWTSADATILTVTHDALDDAIFVPIALLRAMLEAIDAQQGGAS